MALSPSNCFVTLAAANTYFEDRLDCQAWTDADDSSKSKALVTATLQLDDMKWAGIVVSDDQPLAFPRSGSYFDPRRGYDVCFPDVVPTDVEVATFELALHLLNNSGVLDSTGTVTDLSVGPISLQRVQNAPKIPLMVLRKIRPMLLNGGSRSWWRNN
jgi:hypothetical protein